MLLYSSLDGECSCVAPSSFTLILFRSRVARGVGFFVWMLLLGAFTVSVPLYAFFIFFLNGEPLTDSQGAEMVLVAGPLAGIYSFFASMSPDCIFFRLFLLNWFGSSGFKLKTQHIFSEGISKFNFRNSELPKFRTSEPPNFCVPIPLSSQTFSPLLVSHRCASVPPQQFTPHMVCCG